jgi:hypothetical protein
MLDAPADKVYEAVVRRVKKAQGITVPREDASERLIQFTNGEQIAGIKESPLGDGLFSSARLFRAQWIATRRGAAE